MVNLIIDKLLFKNNLPISIYNKIKILFISFIIFLVLGVSSLVFALLEEFEVIFISIFFILLSIFIFILLSRLSLLNAHVATYLAAMAGYSKISIKTLSDVFNTSEKNIRNELYNFSEKGYIPTGRLSQDGLYFKIGDLEGEELVDVNNLSETTENLDFIENGRKYIKLLEKANASMYSNKFFHKELEKTSYAAEVLFKYIENYPTKVPEIKINVNFGLENALKAISEYKELARFSIDSKRIKELKLLTVSSLNKATDDFTSVYSAIKIPENNTKEEITFTNNANEIIKSGRAYVRRIKQCSTAINDEEITIHTDKTENLLEQLFTYLESNKEKTGDVKNLMNRHLPITLKVINKYIEMKKINLNSDNITSLKKEIISAFSALNNAIIYLINKISNDLKLDISTDIDVLKTVIAQDGHTNKKDFNKKD